MYVIRNLFTSSKFSLPPLVKELIKSATSNVTRVLGQLFEKNSSSAEIFKICFERQESLDPKMKQNIIEAKKDLLEIL